MATNLCLPDLARIRVDNRDRRPAEVEEQLLSGDMMLTHAALL